MKKILLALTAVVCMSSFSFAQDKKAKATPAAKPTAAVKSAPAVKPAAATKMAPVAKPAAPTATKMKKDGTPDMRVKANKDAAKAAAGPTKKDGTPDMRYKANKDAAKKKA